MVKLMILYLLVLSQSYFMGYDSCARSLWFGGSQATLGHRVSNGFLLLSRVRHIYFLDLRCFWLYK